MVIQRTDPTAAITTELDAHMRMVEPQTASQLALDDRWIARVRGEYLEMPGLSLTPIQAQRLWGLDAAACEMLLDALVQMGFLRRTHHGGYVRANAD